MMKRQSRSVWLQILIMGLASLGLASLSAAAGGCATPPTPHRTSVRPAAGDDELRELLAADPRTADYVIVAPSAFFTELLPLLRHRLRQGHRPLLLALDQLYPSGADGGTRDPQVLLARLRELVRHGALRYLILIGDPREGYDGVPAFEQEATARRERFGTDQPYSLGDVASGPLAVGRIPARTRAELQGFVGKLVGYETREQHGAWQRRLTMFAGPANFGPLLDGLIEGKAMSLLDRHLPYDFDLSVVFAKLGSPYAYRFDQLGQKLKSDLEQGALLAVYVGHGGRTAFDRVSFRQRSYAIGQSAELAQLSIAQGKPFFVSLTCLTGSYGPHEAERSLAEALALNPGGPIAVFASSGISHPYPNALYAEAFVEQFFEQRAATIGDGVSRSRAAMLSRDLFARLLVPGNVDRIKQDNLLMYNLLGDPATRLRYPGRATVRLSQPAAAPGGSITATVDAGAEVRSGRLRLTLETERRQLGEGIVAAEQLRQLGTEEAFRTMVRNHRLASDKVIREISRPYAGQPATVALEAPLSPGSYHVKALVIGAGSTAVGHAPLLVEAPPDGADGAAAEQAAKPRQP